MPRSSPPASLRSPRGTSLLDALLACLVLGLGVLAALRLPALTERELAAAAQRLQAAHAAANLAAALHAQRGYAAEAPCSLNPCTLLPAPGPAGDDCRARDCTPQRMTAQDLREWSALTQPLLPGARADLRCRPARDEVEPAPAPLPPRTAGSAGSDRRRDSVVESVVDSVCTLQLRLAQGEVLRWRIRP